MNVPDDRIKRAEVTLMFTEFAPMDLVRQNVARALADAIVAKLIEFNKIRFRKDGIMVVAECHVDVIVPH